MKKCILFLIICLISAFPLSAVTLYVPGGYPNVSAALASAGAGDIIEITDSGAYYDSIGVDIPSITIRGAEGQRPTIWNDIMSNPIVAISVNNIRIENIKFIAKQDCPTAIEINGSYNTIYDCEFLTENAVANPNAVNINSGTNNRIVSCDISGYNTGIFAGSTDSMYLFYNVIHQCGYGMNIEDPSGNYLMYNNTVVKNSSDGIYISMMLNNTATADLKNNICYDNQAKDLNFDNASGTLIINLTNNCYANEFMNGLSGYSAYDNLIGIEPGFVHKGNNDFHLRADSPCINAGQSINYASYGFSNAPEVIGSARDIGALEYESVEEPSAGKPQYIRLSANKLTKGKVANITITDLEHISGINNDEEDADADKEEVYIYIKVDIYDLRGKLTRNLGAERVASSQNYELSWDGTDNEGNYVGSGIYFLIVKLNSIVKTEKIFFIQ